MTHLRSLLPTFLLFAHLCGCLDGNFPSNILLHVDDRTTDEEEPDTLPGYLVLSEQADIAISPENYDDTQMISPSEAQHVVWEAYPDLNFGEDIMSGPELVGDVWIDGYMLSAVDGFDIFEVIVDGYNGEIVKEVVLEGYAAHAAPCTVYSISSGTWYSQRDSRWSSILLGNSSVYTIGSDGCLLTSYAMVYHNTWFTPTTPDQLNTSAISRGCFDPGSAIIKHGCTLNSRGGPHWFTFVSMSQVASALCAGYPVVVYVTWGGGHKMLVYRYSGGSTSSMGSYTVVDPWYGTSKTLSSYTATSWIKVY